MISSYVIIPRGSGHLTPVTWCLFEFSMSAKAPSRKGLVRSSSLICLRLVSIRLLVRFVPV